MCVDEKIQLDNEIEERIRLEEIEFKFRERLYIKMGKRFLELYPGLDLPYEDFLAKTKTECWRSYQAIFYTVHDMLKHFKKSDEPFKPGSHQFTSPDYEYYLELKEQNEEAAEAYLNELDEWESNLHRFDMNWYEMGKTALSEIYETFPEMINLSLAAMLEIKNSVYGMARFNLKQFETT